MPTWEAAFELLNDRNSHWYRLSPQVLHAEFEERVPAEVERLGGPEMLRVFREKLRVGRKFRPRGFSHHARVVPARVRRRVSDAFVVRIRENSDDY